MTVKDELGGRGLNIMEKLANLYRAPECAELLMWGSNICDLNYDEVGDLYKRYYDLYKSQILKTEACVNYIVATLYIMIDWIMKDNYSKYHIRRI